MSDIAWAAGLFEGEGSILCAYRLGRRPGRTMPRLSMGSTDLDILERFAATVGGKVKGPYRPNGSKTPTSRKDIYCWRVETVRETQRILRLFWPYLGERRRAKAAEAIASYYETARVPQRARLT